MVTSSTSVADLFLIFRYTLLDIYPGETFIVKDLFREFEWKRIEKNRVSLGSMVFAWANNAGSSVIAPLGKTSEGQQIYKKL